MRKKAIVLGGGLGGLATALTLSTHYDVTMIEQQPYVGGKMHEMTVGAHRFDFGPNTLTMPRYFWDVIAPYTNAKEALPFQKLEYPTHHQLGDFSLTFTTNIDEMVAQLRVIDPQSAANYPRFIEQITQLFHRSERAFLQKTFFSWKDYVSPTLGLDLLRAQPFESLATFIAGFFPHPFVQQLFLRFATYIGSSPYATPATFALIAYFELVEGTYYLQGGAPQIARCFEQLLREQQVNIHTNTKVVKLATDGQRIQFVETTAGRIEADIVISNIDVAVMQELLGRKKCHKPLSTSAYVELIGLKQPIPLHYHNVLFSSHYEREFTQLVAGTYAQHPTVYSCYPYAADSSRLPALFVLINAPHDAADDDAQRARVDEALMKWGIDQQHIAERQIVPPLYITQSFSVRDGAIYGQASNDWQGSFFRPRNKDVHLQNLYYVGGTVHPGGGSPIVVKGGYEVAKRIIAEHK